MGHCCRIGGGLLVCTQDFDPFFPSIAIFHGVSLSGVRFEAETIIVIGVGS